MSETTLTEADKRRIEEEEKYRMEVREDLGKTPKQKPKEEEENYRTDIRKEKKKGKGCLTAIGLLVGFFILIGVISGGGEKEKKTPTPTPVKQEKTEAKSETISDEMAKLTAYSEKLLPINTRASEYLGKRGELTGRWPNWTNEDVINFAASGIGLELAYDEAKELTPPKIMVSSYQKWLKGLELFSRSVPILNKGIDNIDIDLINESTVLMKEGGGWVVQATKEMEEITEKFN